MAILKKKEKEIMVIEELMLDFNLASFSMCVFSVMLYALFDLFKTWGS